MHVLEAKFIYCRSRNFSSLKIFHRRPFPTKLNTQNILGNVRRPIPILVAKVWWWNLDYMKYFQVKYFTCENIPIYSIWTIIVITKDKGKEKKNYISHSIIIGIWTVLLVFVSLFFHTLHQESRNQAGVKPTREKTTNPPIGQQSLLHGLLEQHPDVGMRVVWCKGSNGARITASNWKILLRINQWGKALWIDVVRLNVARGKGCGSDSISAREV